MPILNNGKYERYCQHYVGSDVPCIYDSMKFVGYSDSYSKKQGFKLHDRPEIQERIGELSAERNERLGIQDQQDRVITELESIGYSDIVSVLLAIRLEGPAKIESLKVLTKEQRSSIQEITFYEESGCIEKIKLHPKVASLKLIGDHEGMFKSDKRGGIMFFMDADYGGVEGAEDTE